MVVMVRLASKRLRRRICKDKIGMVDKSRHPNDDPHYWGPCATLDNGRGQATCFGIKRYKHSLADRQFSSSCDSREASSCDPRPQ